MGDFVTGVGFEGRRRGGERASLRLSGAAAGRARASERVLLRKSREKKRKRARAVVRSDPSGGMAVKKFGTAPEGGIYGG